jgi:quinoprotein glucose dehydrogenase
VDEDLGLVYLPVETPSSDYYGGHRPGNNLFAETLVCVDLRTGQRKWHFQFVHHPLWNFDMSSAPILADITVNGRAIKAVAVPSKQAWLYVFDRVTGQPVWPIEERPVPQSDVPGEKTSATQPHPPDKLRYARNFFNVPNDLIDFTPELRAAAIERTKQYRWATTPFNPPMLGNVSGLLGAITVGTATNWPGGGFDPETHILYAPSGNTPGVRSLVATPPGYSDLRYITGVAGRPVVEVWGPGDCCAADSGRRNRAELPTTRGATPAGGAPAAPAPPADEGGGGLNIQGIPIVKPPYGFLAAIDLDRGEVLFQAPHGDTPDNIRNHPALKGVNIPKTGQAGTSGVGLVITKTLVVMGDPQITTTPEHPRGAMLRAYDKKTGQQVGALLMPAIQSGTPMTYMVDGKQYIMVAVSGGNYSGEYIAYSLPN